MGVGGGWSIPGKSEWDSGFSGGQKRDYILSPSSDNKPILSFLIQLKFAQILSSKAESTIVEVCPSNDVVSNYSFLEVFSKH